ncbi:MAG: hypothetical protein J6P45_06980, partial [Lachnospiraceae bacterium]|nr:hypothetical protein [Lachnospiraceae bacterium]
IWTGGLSSGYYYTGCPIKPAIRVYCGNRRLIEKKDYTIAYKNNKNVSTGQSDKNRLPRVIVRLKGNYRGKLDLNFNIKPMPLSLLSADGIFMPYREGKRNNNVKPEFTFNGDKIRYSKKDIKIRYFTASENRESDCRDEGDYIISVTKGDTGNFTGEKDVFLKVCDGTVMSGVHIGNYSKSYQYDGNPVTPDFVVKTGSEILSLGADYTVSLNGNTEIGTATALFTGNGKTTFGTKKLTFNIRGKYTIKESEVRITPGEETQYYTYGGAKPSVIVSYNGIRLKEGTDYTVSYKNNKAVAKAGDSRAPQIIVKGRGKYRTDMSTGIIKDFTVVPRPLSTMLLTISDRVYSKSKNAYKNTRFLFTDEDYTDQRLKKGEKNDYIVEFHTKDGKDVPAVGEIVTVSVNAAGNGNYIGSISGSYRIIDKSQDINRAAVVINNGKPCEYTGSGIEPGDDTGGPGLTLNMKKNRQTVTLNKGSDYEICGYFNNVICTNKAVVLIRGKGKYAGIRAVRFRISSAEVDDEIKGT